MAADANCPFQTLNEAMQFARIIQNNYTRLNDTILYSDDDINYVSSFAYLK